MRLILFIFAALAIGIALTLLVDNPGYVLIAREPWSMETSLGIFLLLLLGLFILLYLFFRLLAGLVHAPAALGRWQQRRNIEQALELRRKGLAALIVGDWEGGEKLLLRRVDDTPNPGVSYLAAAWCAQQQGARDRRDGYLAAASKDGRAADSQLAIGILQARMQVQAGQREHALATVNHLRTLEPTNQVVLGMLVGLLRQSADWPTLLALLETTRKHAGLDDDTVQAICRSAAHDLFAAATDAGELEQALKQFPKALRQDSAIIISQARALLRLQRDDACELLLRNSIKRHWDEAHVELYGQVQGSDPAAQLKHAEAWATEHPYNSSLMLTLGRLAIRSQLWGVARSYLEVAVNNADRPEPFLELGWLLDRLEQPSEARELYRRGLEMSLSGRTATLPQPGTADTSPTPADTAVQRLSSA